MRIDQDAFEEWKAHPITEAFMKSLRVWSAEERQKWLSASWDGGACDPVLLARHKERSTLLEQLAAVGAEQIEEALNG